MDMETAQKMLAAASLERECDDVIRRQDCSSCDEWWPVAMPALQEIQRLGFKSATLAAYILTVEALEAGRNKFRHAADYLIRNHPGDKNDALLARALRQDAREIDKALAAWEKL